MQIVPHEALAEGRPMPDIYGTYQDKNKLNCPYCGCRRFEIRCPGGCEHHKGDDCIHAVCCGCNTRSCIGQVRPGSLSKGVHEEVHAGVEEEASEEGDLKGDGPAGFDGPPGLKEWEQRKAPDRQRADAEKRFWEREERARKAATGF